MSNILEKFVGDWRGNETIHPSKWGEGGHAEAVVTAHFSCEEKILVQNYAAVRHHKKWLEVHAVFHATESGLQLYWFDSLGFFPHEPAPGHWDHERLIFTRTSPRGMTQHIYHWQDENTYEMKLQTSFDQGATWVPVMDGIYKRQLK